MFISIAVQEFKQQVKSRQFWGFAVFFTALAVVQVILDASAIGGAGNIGINAPVNLANRLYTTTIIASFLIAVILAPSVSRDFELNTWQLIYSTPISRYKYLLGKFVGSLCAVYFCFSFAFLAQILVIHSPLAPGEVNPFNLDHYLFTLLILVLPNLFIMSVLLFTVSTVTRKNLYAYVFVVLLYVFFAVSSSLTSSQMFSVPPILLDLYAVSTLQFLTQYWTPYELNTLSLPVSGMLLSNRLVWIGISVGLIVLTLLRFNVYPRSESSKAKPETGEKSEPIKGRPLVSQVHSSMMSWQQFISRTGFELGSILLATPFLIMLSLGLAKVFFSATFREASFAFGIPPLPVSFVLASQLTSDFVTVLMIVMIYYSGELVWRERQVRIHEILDATPAGKSAFILSKVICLWLVVGVTALVGALGMMVFQLAHGTPIAMDVYARELSFMIFPFIWISVLAILIQTLAPNKFIGMGAVTLYLVFRLVGGQFFDAINLFVFATHPSVPISEMAPSSWEHFEALKYDGYWGALCIGLIVLIFLFWQRGSENRVGLRVKNGWSTKTVPQLVVLSLSLLVFVWFGRSLYLEDYVNNPVPAGNDYQDAFKVRYEQVLRHLEDEPILRSKELSLEVDTYLATRQMHSRGQLVLENTSPDTAVNEVYLGIPTNTTDYHMTLSGAVLQEEFPLIRHFRYELDQPMQPGETRTVAFDFKVDLSEFPGGTVPGIDSWRLKESGVWMKSYAFLPWTSYLSDLIIGDPKKRKEYGLQKMNEKVARHDEEWGRYRTKNALASYMDSLEVVYGVDAGQTAVVSGELINNWEEQDRHYFRYKSHGAPSPGDVTIMQGAWDAVHERVGDVDMTIYYHPVHDVNVQGFMEYSKAALVYMDKHWAPYPYRQFSIAPMAGFGLVEPGAGILSMAEELYVGDWQGAGTTRLGAAAASAFVSASLWAFTIPFATMEGSAVLGSGIPIYSAVAILESHDGRDAAGRLIARLISRYHKERNASKYEEVPVARSLSPDSQYVGQEKFAAAFYGLKEMIGEEAINKVLRDYYEEWKFARAPYATVLDFMKHLRANTPAEYQDTITDYFERILVHDIAVLDAEVEPTADGRFKVSATISTRKYERTPDGKEEPVSIHEPIQIVVVDDSIHTTDRYGAHRLAETRRWIDEETMVVEFVVDQEPAAVVVDPIHNFIERNINDNVRYFE